MTDFPNMTVVTALINNASSKNEQEDARYQEELDRRTRKEISERIILDSKDGYTCVPLCIPADMNYAQKLIADLDQAYPLCLWLYHAHNDPIHRVLNIDSETCNPSRGTLKLAFRERQSKERWRTEYSNVHARDCQCISCI